MPKDEAAAEIAPINFYTIFRDSRREAFYRQNRDKPLFFDPGVKAWIVTNPDECRYLLASPDVSPAPGAQDYSAMAQQLGLPDLSFAFHQIPLAMEGERHTRSRRSASEFLTMRRDAIRTWIKESLPVFLAPFGERGRFDVSEAVIRPLVLNFFETAADIAFPPDMGLDEISLLFDRSTSMSRWRRIETRMGALRKHIASAIGPTASDEEVGTRLALLILGKDALIGTLCESLHGLFVAFEGRRLAEIVYPASPQQTGVPFVERIARVDFEYAGALIARNDRMKLFLQTFAYGEAAQHHRFFGAGVHACIGRPVSLDLWQALTAQLSQSPLRAHVIDYTPSPYSYVFNYPTKFEVELVP